MEKYDIELDKPEPGDWECALFGSSFAGGGIIWRPGKGSVPNAFWRFMQFLIFGNRWRKRPATKERGIQWT